MDTDRRMIASDRVNDDEISHPKKRMRVQIFNVALDVWTLIGARSSIDLSSSVRRRRNRDDAELKMNEGCKGCVWSGY